MTSAKMTSKGQITTPAGIQEDLHVGTADRVKFVEVESGRYQPIAATRSVTDLKGMFGKAVRTVSIDEMNAAISTHGAST